MKEATENEYDVSQKLAYEKGARRDLEVEFEVVLKSLQNVTLVFPKKIKCKPICMPGSSFMHIVT
jgi:hypothetical protein